MVEADKITDERRKFTGKKFREQQSKLYLPENKVDSLSIPGALVWWRKVKKRYNWAN